MTTSDNSAPDAWQPPAIDTSDTPASRHRQQRVAAHEARLAAELRAARDEGYARGHAEADKEFTALRSRLNELVRCMTEPLDELSDDVEAALVDLSLRIARQVVRRELQTDRAQVLVIAREALAALPINARQIRMSLHPDDAQLLRDSLAESDGTPQWTLVEDPLMTRGGVRVQSERSVVDATVEKRLNNITEQLIDNERSRPRGGAEE
ncbi:MAG: FliH/SctL family protein [Pseudomonadota bacterium]